MRAQSGLISYQFYLRTQHAEYLRSQAQGSGESISGSFAKLIETARLRPDMRQDRPTHQERLHLTVSGKDEEFLEELCRKWGLTRSNVVRRLIEMAEDGRLATQPEAVERSASERVRSTERRRRTCTRPPRRAYRSPHQLDFWDVG